MSDRFSVNPASLRAAGSLLGVQGAQLSAALGRLQSSLVGLGDVCGDDAPGQAFAAQYRPRSQDLGHALLSLARGLDSIERGLGTMADNYEAAEQANRMRRAG